jgi:Na+/H+ antiporter NhaD/arsenite permease-like protein
MGIVAGIILACTYVGIAVARLPWVNLDRPAAALAGGVLMVVLGVITFPQAVDAVDFHTIALLFGMMLFVVVLQEGGFFTLLARRSVAIARTRGQLMAAVVVATGVASAFLVNDVVVLLFTPVIVQACRMQRLNPVPYLIGEAMASNIGSTATIVGNPQNMLIGVTSGISFARFFAVLAPVAAVSTLILLAVLWLSYRGRLAAAPAAVGAVPSGGAGVETKRETPVDRRLLRRVLPLLLVVVAAFFASSFIGVEVPVIALVAGVAATLVSGIKPSEVIGRVDWALLVFFVGLFIVIGGVRHAGVLDPVFSRVDLGSDAVAIVSIHAVSAVVSQLVSNVPLTVLMLPLMEQTQGDVLWLSLAAGATLAGNATLIGAVANIIVAEQAAKDGVRVTFGEFLKPGLIVTVLTVLASVGMLELAVWAGWV